MHVRPLITALRRAVLGSRVGYAASPDGSAEGFVRIHHDQVPWVPENDGTGVERAVLAGDPSQPGLYVVRVKFPKGMMSLPHFHREDRHAVVISGTWYTGTGDDFEPDKTIGLKPGSYMKHPAGAHHYDGAKDEEVVVQIIGEGPSETTRLRPELGNFGPSLRP